jgi:hypothetical protein
MTSNITVKPIFTLFNSNNSNSNLAYIDIIDNKNITLSNSQESLSLIQDITIAPTAAPSTNNDTGIIINPQPNIYIDKYTTLQIQYLIDGSASSIALQLINKQTGIDTPEGTTFTLTTSSSKTTTNLHFFTEHISHCELRLYFSSGSTNGIVIRQFDLLLLEGDQMVYVDDVIPPTYNKIEDDLFIDVSGGTGSYGITTVSGVHKSLYLSIPNLISTTVSGVILDKQFDKIDYPAYTQTGLGISGYTTDIINSSSGIVGNNNLNIPIGYNYLWKFIFNDITFTNTPSLELTGIYGDFNKSTYYNANEEYETIVMGASDPPGTNYQLGYKIKLKEPTVDSSGIFNASGENKVDSRNSDNYIVKKINIIFIKFHNAMFDYFYNNVDVSGVAITTANKLITHAHAPLINSNGSNSKDIFEFIRRHVILHYHSMLIYDVLERYCDPSDVTSYIKENDCNNTTSISGTSLHIEFVELVRLLSQFDQNEIKMSNTNNLIRKHKLYDRTQFTTYENIGTTVSGILWSNLFKTMIQLPQYSKKILPQITVTDSSGNAMNSTTTTTVTTADIQDLNSYFYVGNTRLINNKIASGQKINSLLTNGSGEALCQIIEDVFIGGDINSLLSTHNFLTSTPFLYYILYESSIFTRGRKLAKDGVGSNVLLKNMMNCLYNSTINYTKFYLNKTPQLFNFNSGGIDNSGNIRIGTENADFTMKTVSTIFMRDIIRAATSSDLIGNQRYHIFTIPNIYSVESQYKEFIDANNDFIYVSEDNYKRLKGLKGKIYTEYNEEKYVFTDCREKNYVETGASSTTSILYQIKLNHPDTTLTFPDISLTFIFYSNIET